MQNILEEEIFMDDPLEITIKEESFFLYNL